MSTGSPILINTSVRLDRPVGQWWVAGAEDQAVLHLVAQLLLQRGPHIDLGEDPEAVLGRSTIPQTMSTNCFPHPPGPARLYSGQGPIALPGRLREGWPRQGAGTELLGLRTRKRGRPESACVPGSASRARAPSKVRTNPPTCVTARSRTRRRSPRTARRGRRARSGRRRPRSGWPARLGAVRRVPLTEAFGAGPPPTRGHSLRPHPTTSGAQPRPMTACSVLPRPPCR